MRLFTIVIETEKGKFETKTHEAENLIHAMFFLDDAEAENIVSIASYQINQGENPETCDATEAP